MGYNPQETISGSQGEAWLDGDYLSNAFGLQAKIKLVKEEVKMCKVMGKKYKVTGYEGTGTLKLSKKDSRMLIKLAKNLQQGKTTVCQLISKLDDPDVAGAEKIAIKDATFDEIDLINWEAKKILEENIPFTFSEYEIYEWIEP
jgi:hypothetical protein